MELIHADLALQNKLMIRSPQSAQEKFFRCRMQIKLATLSESITVIASRDIDLNFLEESQLQFSPTVLGTILRW